MTVSRILLPRVFSSLRFSDAILYVILFSFVSLSDDKPNWRDFPFSNGKNEESNIIYTRSKLNTFGKSFSLICLLLFDLKLETYRKSSIMKRHES